MSIASLVGLGAFTLFMLFMAIYANTHRAEDSKKKQNIQENKA
ncbi:hypothetical protein [Sulfuriferula nivalis]|nr:hypothetical protein [Sulfuriferula nivalis]